MSDHIPDPGHHRTLLYGHYANRRRGARRPSEDVQETQEKPRRRCSPSWARLIARVYQVDPLICSRCGKKMALLAFVTDTFAVRRILDHLGLSPPEQRLPPLHEVRQVPVDEEGRELSAP